MIRWLFSKSASGGRDSRSLSRLACCARWSLAGCGCGWVEALASEFLATTRKPRGREYLWEETEESCSGRRSALRDRLEVAWEGLGIFRCCRSSLWCEGRGFGTTSQSKPESRSREWLTRIPEQVFLWVFLRASVGPKGKSSVFTSLRTRELLLCVRLAMDLVLLLCRPLAGAGRPAFSSFFFFAGESKSAWPATSDLSCRSRGGTFGLAASIRTLARECCAGSCLSRAYLRSSRGWLVQAVFVAVVVAGDLLLSLLEARTFLWLLQSTRDQRTWGCEVEAVEHFEAFGQLQLDHRRTLAFGVVGGQRTDQRPPRLGDPRVPGKTETRTVAGRPDRLSSGRRCALWPWRPRLAGRRAT